MKRIIFSIAILVLTSSVAIGQITRPAIIKKKTEPGQTKTAPAETAPPAPVTLVYTLTAVKANIRTGTDNKEFPSVVRAGLSARNSSAAYFKQENLKNEMKVNSNTEFGLEKAGTGPITLDDLQKNGLRFDISYFANFQLDAWKIEGVTITLEFRDQFGNLHPAYGQKSITFGNASGFLNGYNENRMTCTTDGYFNPLSAQITK